MKKAGGSSFDPSGQMSAHTVVIQCDMKLLVEIGLLEHKIYLFKHLTHATEIVDT